MLFIILMPLLGVGVAMFRRSPHTVLDGPTEDAPLRLLRWTAGLLSEPRDESGQAMLGELDPSRTASTSGTSSSYGSHGPDQSA